MNKQGQWKNRFQEIVQICQDELKRTTEIGKKMLNASKANSQLHETYEELGAYVLKALESKDLVWNDEKAHSLVAKIKDIEKEMEVIEEEMNKIKFSSGPTDVSKENSKEQ